MRCLASFLLLVLLPNFLLHEPGLVNVCLETGRWSPAFAGASTDEPPERRDLPARSQSSCTCCEEEEGETPREPLRHSSARLSCCAGIVIGLDPNVTEPTPQRFEVPAPVERTLVPPPFPELLENDRQEFLARTRARPPDRFARSLPLRI